LALQLHGKKEDLRNPGEKSTIDEKLGERRSPAVGGRVIRQGGQRMRAQRVKLGAKALRGPDSALRMSNQEMMGEVNG
jgi:hypothetical protein